jgi:hypothetical protein
MRFSPNFDRESNLRRIVQSYSRYISGGLKVQNKACEAVYNYSPLSCFEGGGGGGVRGALS